MSKSCKSKINPNLQHDHYFVVPIKKLSYILPQGNLNNFYQKQQMTGYKQTVVNFFKIPKLVSDFSFIQALVFPFYPQEASINRLSQECTLFAANGSAINTYGFQLLSLTFGMRRSFPYWQMFNIPLWVLISLIIMYQFELERMTKISTKQIFKQRQNYSEIKTVINSSTYHQLFLI